jgi:hypothetical protein
MAAGRCKTLRSSTFAALDCIRRHAEPIETLARGVIYILDFAAGPDISDELMDTRPNPSEPKPRRAAEGLDPARRPDRPAVTDGGTGSKSYTDKPYLTAGNEGAVTRKRRWRWVMIVALAATLAVSGTIWKQDSLPHWTHPWSTVQQEQVQEQTLTLTEADVDQAATDAARAALSRGEIPPVLAKADAETRSKVLSGEEKLYTKNLLNENEDKEVIVHVQVSSGGVLLGEDTLTMAHQNTTTFPARPGVPTLFHHTVEKAGPSGVVTCYLQSAAGTVVHTPPMAAGQSGDFETIVR